MNAKERSTAWAIDQLEPDNWLRIPDFGINPQDVAFEGFAFPMVTPSSKGRGLQCILREHVKTARALIRKEKRSLDKVKADFLEVLDMIDEKPESEHIDASRQQGMATFYIISLQIAERASQYATDRNSKSLGLCYEAIAECAEAVRNLTLFSVKDKKEPVSAAINEAIAGYVGSQRRALSEAGRKGAAAKNMGHEELKAWALNEAKTMYAPHGDIARRLAALLPAHLANVSKDPERLIYDTLRNPKKPD